MSNYNFSKNIKYLAEKKFWIIWWPKVVQPYFHLKTCCIVNNNNYISDKAVFCAFQWNIQNSSLKNLLMLVWFLHHCSLTSLPLWARLLGCCNYFFFNLNCWFVRENCCVLLCWEGQESVARGFNVYYSCGSLFEQIKKHTGW